MTSNQKGQLAQSKTELRAIELGIIPSKPIFDARYDLILDISGRLYKIQIKYAEAGDVKSVGAVNVTLAYVNRKKEIKTYSKNEIDVIIVYIPQIDKLCWIGPEIFEDRKILRIRYAPAKNNQVDGCLFAKDLIW